MSSRYGHKANGQTEEASERFLKPGTGAAHDFENFLAAYFVTYHQKNIPDKLKWFVAPLQLALIIDDEAVNATLSTLYLNIAKCYKGLNNPDNAKKVVNYPFHLMTRYLTSVPFITVQKPICR